MPTGVFIAAAVLIYLGIVAAYVLAMAAVARVCGVRATGAWVGYGPTVWSRQTRFGLFRLGVIPIDGAVTFAGEEDDGTEARDGFRAAPALARATILLSGPLSSLLLGAVLLAVPVLLASPQLAAGGTGREVPHSSVGPLAVEDRPTTAAGQGELVERTAGEVGWRLLTFDTLEGYGGWVGGFYTAGRAATESWPALLSLMGVAAVAHGLASLLPLAGFNGFHLVLIAVEAAVGRRLPEWLFILLIYPLLVITLVLFARLVIADARWLWAVL